ncbi:MAG: EAL domain-containing protein [Ectothiorhodospiraceae bacterium]|nr:EAL domain-containing protein [Ectothiorhodospiraceae bacterium]
MRMPIGPGTERILALELQPSVQESLRALALADGLPLDLAETEDDARARLSRGNYGVLLLDPFQDPAAGDRLLTYVQETGQDVHVVVATGDPSQRAAVRALRLGAQDFLRKPYAPEELLFSLRNALENRRLQRENRHFQSRLKSSGQLYRFIVERSPDLIYVLDHNGCFRFVNPAVERLLGYVPDTLLGQHYSTIVAPEDQERARHVIEERRADPRVNLRTELRLVRADDDGSIDSMVTVELTAMGMYAEQEDGRDGRYLGTYGVARDITDRKRAEDAVRYQAHHDQLTALPNRMLFKHRLRAALDNNARDGNRLAVLFLDLDRFKLVNDSQGHAFGDRLLEAVARRLRGCIRDGDTLARLGGDEFVALLPLIRDVEDAERVAGKFIEAMSNPFQMDNHEIHVGISAGIAISPDHGTDVDTLVKHADVAMYHSKDAGGGGWAVYEPSMSDRVDQHFNLEVGLRQALARNELRVLYQPQVELATGRVHVMEALLRWQHPSAGMISPKDFIPVAEQTGLIVPISYWLIRTACTQLRDWCAQGHATVRLAVNLSPVQLQEPDFAEQLLQILEETGFPPSSLELEITEQLFMKDVEAVAAKLRALTQFGITFAVDDFGTGYSSLSYLQQLPIHALKIDQSFVQRLARDGDQGHLVGAIVAMGQSMGLKVIAEGVETVEQASILRKLKCSDMQGYLFSPPDTLEAASTLRVAQVAHLHAVDCSR